MYTLLYNFVYIVYWKPYNRDIVGFTATSDSVTDFSLQISSAIYTGIPYIPTLIPRPFHCGSHLPRSFNSTFFEFSTFTLPQTIYTKPCKPLSTEVFLCTLANWFILTLIKAASYRLSTHPPPSHLPYPTPSMAYSGGDYGEPPPVFHMAKPPNCPRGQIFC